MHNQKHDQRQAQQEQNQMESKGWKQEQHEKQGGHGNQGDGLEQARGRAPQLDRRGLERVAEKPAEQQQGPELPGPQAHQRRAGAAHRRGQGG